MVSYSFNGPPAAGEDRPTDDVLKRGNYDLFADRGTDVERVRETLFDPASGMAGAGRLQRRAGITRGQRFERLPPDRPRVPSQRSSDIFQLPTRGGTGTCGRGGTGI